MTGLEIFFIIFLILIVLALFIFFAVLKYRMQEEEEENDIIWNLGTDRCNKRSTGVMKSIITGRGRRSLITYTAKDINDNKTEVVKMIVDKYIDCPKGSPSQDRGLKILMPRNSEDISPSIRDTPLGQILSKYIENKNTEGNIINVLRESKNRQDIIRMLHGGGELSKEEIARRNELLHELSKLLVKGAEKKTDLS